MFHSGSSSKGTTVGTIIIAHVPWSLLSKGTTEQDVIAKGTTVGTIIIAHVSWSLWCFSRVPWSLLAKGTTEQKL